MLQLCFLTFLLLFCKANAQGQNIPDAIAMNATGVVPVRDVKFFLYTRDNGQNPEQLWVNDETALMQSTYDTGRATKIVTHGWKSNGTSQSCVQVRKAFLTHDDYNVIVVDWNAAEDDSNYILSASRVKVVGNYIGRMIDFLVNEGTDVNSMSLVGHSLGAHVVGLAGRNATQKVSQIVGLDPAGPGFILETLNDRISKTDGQYVQIIHTNAGLLGIQKAVGDIDYYVNGGSVQPGCGADVSGSCAHARSFMYYSESITDPDRWFAILCRSLTGFLAGQCKGYPVVEFPRWSAGSSRPEGIYRLRTKAKSPYGLGVEGLTPLNPIRRFANAIFQ